MFSYFAYVDTVGPRYCYWLWTDTGGGAHNEDMSLLFDFLGGMHYGPPALTTTKKPKDGRGMMMSISH